MNRKTPGEKLAIHGGTPVKPTPFGSGPKHNLTEWRAIKPIFERGNIHMTRGPEIMALREKFKKLFGMKYAATASSGTAALHSALGALEIGRGDEVITSPITDMGTLVAILQLNAVPIFADIDPLTQHITPDTVAAKVTRRTKALVVVHLAGQSADMKGIMRVARKHRLGVVEDMAQSYLCKQGNRYAGTMGDIGCWSLNESKHIGAGDGGILLTNSQTLARRADLFADKCYNREGGVSDPAFAPYNYRLNTLVAGVCLEQMKRVRSICSRRHTLGTRLDRTLDRIDGVAPRPIPKGDYATYWYYVFNMDPGILSCTNAEFAEAMRAEGVSTGAGTLNVMEWKLFREHTESRHACADTCPLYKGKQPDYDISSYPGIQRAKACALRMPMSEFFTNDDVRDMGKAIAKVATHYRR